MVKGSEVQTHVFRCSKSTFCPVLPVLCYCYFLFLFLQGSPRQGVRTEVGWVTSFHLSQLSPGVPESKKNIRKTVALVISTLTQNAKQNLQ